MREFCFSGKRLDLTYKLGRWFSLLIVFLLCTALQSQAQSTSWTGNSSTSWFTSGNWTNGVPSSNTDVIIGDVNFTGIHNPSFSSNTTVKSITIGGAKAATFTLTNYKSVLNVVNGVTIAANGTLDHSASIIEVKGNWNNSGTYLTASSRTGNKTYFARVSMAGTTQNISGATTFMDLTVSQSSIITLNNAITVTKNFIVAGIFDPLDNLVTLTNANFVLESSGTLKIKASTYAGNYSIAPSTAYTTSTFEFAANDRPQSITTIGGKVFPTLLISGTSTKTLGGNISFTSASSSVGKLLVTSGTFDLGSFTASRGTTTAGGVISVMNGAHLKIGGTNTFPANFTTHTIGPTSTIEYNGGGQTVTAETYGNLILSTSQGSAATKTMPALDMTTAGDLTASATGTGSAVTFTANKNLTVNGNLNLGANTTFNGSTFTHTIDGDWVNQGGTFTAGSSTVVLRGTGRKITGSSNTTFNNLTITSDIQGKATGITVAGNLVTSGAGTFVHKAEINGAAAAGTFTMSGTTKTISGADITFDNLVVSGTVASTSNLTLTGNLTVSNAAVNAFNLTAGTILFTGTGKTIVATAANSIAFHAVQVQGTISTTASFSLASDFSGTGELAATAGTVTFKGSSTYTGTHKFFNVTVNGTKLQLGANATLGIGSSLALSAGIFDVTSSVPNTVNYNGGNQAITGATYHTLLLSGTGTKTAGSAFTANGNVEIKAGATLTAGTFTHTVKGNWLNNGAFTANTSTIQFTGNENELITGATTFHGLTINKSNSSALVTLASNVSAVTVDMKIGEMRTGANTLTITSSRTGNGVILGTITRTHSFSANTAYAFESPFNTISFATVSGVTSVTVKVTSSKVNSFPYGGSINRLYVISVPNGTYSNAKLRLHYNDRELNGNTEETMFLWKHNAGSWISVGHLAQNTTENWVEQSSLESVAGEWTISDDNNVLQWVGTTSSDWHTASNWSFIKGNTDKRVPTITDIVEIGGYDFIHQPIITNNASVKSLQFGSVKPATLTLAGGNLDVAGNLNGNWSTNATHTLAIGNQNLTVVGGLELSNGTLGQAINLSIASGRVFVGEELEQTGNAEIAFSGSGNLVLDDNFIYSNGTFSAGSGTVTYTGSNNQIVAGNIRYNNLVINKSSGTATLAAPATIQGTLSLVTGGAFVAENTLSILGDVAIGAGTTFNSGSSLHSVGGNWNNNGSFIPSTGTIRFNGEGDQTITATTFNTLVIAKPAGKAILGGNLMINDNVMVEAGILDMGVLTIWRSAIGGTFTLGDNAMLYISGANNFPGNFNTNTLANNSTVFYQCVTSQNVAKVAYGNIRFQNGTTNAKTLIGAITVNGNLTIDNGATLNAGSFTLTAKGNVTNLGTFKQGTGTVILGGASKQLEGSWVFHDLTVTGNYTLSPGTPLTINNSFYNSGTIGANTNTITFDGDFTNIGTVSTDGITFFTGTKQQTIQLRGPFASPNFGSKIFFNGSVAPILNSNNAPNFITVFINNTAGVAPSIGWNVFGLFKVSSGAAFYGGSSSHNFLGAFVNEGVVKSDGIMNFSPSATQTIALGTSFENSATVRFGGSGRISFSSFPANFAGLEIANTNIAGITFPKSLTLVGDLVIKSGSILYAGDTLRHTLHKNFLNEGTLYGDSSTFTFSKPNAVLKGTGKTYFHHLVFSDTTTIASDIKISGNLINNGHLVAENNNIHFNGSSRQSIMGIKEVPFFDLTTSNPAGFTLNNPTTVAGTLRLENGNINTNGHILTVGSSPTDLGSVEVQGTGMVIGKLKRWIAPNVNEDNHFPVGAGNNRRTATIHYTTAPSGGTLMAEFVTADPGKTGLPLAETIDNNTVSITNVGTSGYWRFTAGASAEEQFTGGQYNITLEATNFAGIGLLDNLVVLKREDNTQPWALLGDYAAVGGNARSPILSRTGLVGFSDFAVGGSDVTPLPVTLVSFKASAQELNAVITWATASETNNKGFYVEVSTDTRQYRTLGFVPSKEENSVLQQTYQFLDTETGKAGARYYRLKQIDLDGKTTFYGPKVATFKTETTTLMAYPNPFSGSVDILVNAKADEAALLTLQNLDGREIFSATRQLSKGRNMVALRDLGNLAPGIYLLKSQIGQTVSVIRLIKE